MALTKYGVNDALAVKLWSKKLAVEALKATEIAPLIGESSSSIIQHKTETKKSAGDKITYGLRMQLTGDGVTENETLEGNEESLTTYSDALLINELAHAVRVKNKQTIDNQRILFDARLEAKDGLRDWYAKRMAVSFFNQAAGNVAQSDTKYTGFNSATAHTSNRRLFVGNAGADESLASTNTFDLNYIDYAKEKALTADPQIRPCKVGGQDKYVIYLHPYQVTDLRINTSTGQWLDIQKAAMEGGRVSKNPIYTGALGEYNDVIIRWSHNVPEGVNSSTSATVSNTRRAVFLGAQAACIAFAKDKDIGSYKWVEETFDYQRELGVSVQTCFGLKKSVFNSEDFGVITVSSYAAAKA